MKKEVTDNPANITKTVRTYCNEIIYESRVFKNQNPNDVDICSPQFQKIHECIMKLLQYLVGLEIDSYKYTLGSNGASQNLEYNTIAAFLLYIVNSYSLKDSSGSGSSKEKSFDIDSAFTAYYLLSYMYRLYDPDKLRPFLDKYENLFWGHYALAYQIRGRLLRAEGQLQDAIQNDRLALSFLEDKGIDNIGVKVTHAASIALLLEDYNDSVDESEIRQAIENVIQAIQINRTYTRYYYLLSTLRLYCVRNNIIKHFKNGRDDWSESEIWEKELMEAEKSINKALDLLDESSPSYVGFLVTYNITLDRIKRTRFDIDLYKRGEDYYENQNNIFYADTTKNMRNLFEDWRKELKSEIEEAFNQKTKAVQDNVNEELEGAQNRYLEIMAVFAAIIGVIMTMISLLSHNYKIGEVLLGMIVMNSSVLIVYSFFEMILSNKVKGIAVISILFGCALIYYSLLVV